MSISQVASGYNIYVKTKFDSDSSSVKTYLNMPVLWEKFMIHLNKTVEKM